jgi:hypothetical protein
MKMKRKPLQVSLHVNQPSVVELTVEDKVQLDRLTPASHGYVAERHGDLLHPGVTTLELEQGFYLFKTLSDAHLKVVHGGVHTSVTVTDPKDPWPPPVMSDETPPSAVVKGDEPSGEAPALTVEHAPEERR